MSPSFRIEIIDQGWICPEAEDDICSHGEIDLWIGGHQITKQRPAEQTEWSYGISEAALALLRTLKYRHTERYPVAWRLIPHGCGTILMLGCDMGINWQVRHIEDTVHITDVCRFDTNNILNPVRFPEADTQLPWAVYSEQIIGFARKAKSFFDGVEVDGATAETIPGEYDGFWSEFDYYLEHASEIIERDLIRGDPLDSAIEFHP